MCRYLSGIIIGVLCVIKASGATPCSVTDALEYFQRPDIDNMEGVWEFVDDKITVAMVRENVGEFPCYSLIVVDSRNIFLTLGCSIGSLRPTSQRGEYEAYIATTCDKTGAPQKPRRFKAKVGDDFRSMVITPVKGKWSFTISPSSILPRFFNVVRLRERSERGEPSSGFIKIFPSYDGNGSSRFAPRIL